VVVVVVVDVGVVVVVVEEGAAGVTTIDGTEYALLPNRLTAATAKR
jgi:F0F1-type ATP synthase assembly protein I